MLKHLKRIRVQRAVDKIQARVKRRIGDGCIVFYDAFPYDQKGLPIDNLDVIAVHGLVQCVDEIWDTYVGGVLENPTWLDLAVEANRVILASGDDHHKYLERVEVMKITEEGVKILSLDMGS